MPALFTDDFTRGDGTGLGVNWTDINAGWNIASNRAVSRTGGSFNLTRLSSWAGGDDQYAKIAIVTLGGSSCAVRIAAAAVTAYGVYARSDGGADLVRTVAGADTIIAQGFPANGSNGGDLAAGDLIEVRAVGDTISAWCNGVQFLSVTDANITTGRPGLNYFSTGATIDDFEAGNFSSGTSIAVPVGSLVMAGYAGAPAIVDPSVNDALLVIRKS